MIGRGIQKTSWFSPIFCVFVLFLSFTFLTAKVILVPEEYRSIQEAFLIAKNEDTVSYKVPTPEYSPYEAGVYYIPLPRGERKGEGVNYKKIHVGLRYPGWTGPRDMEMSSKEIYPESFSTIQDSGYWTPQEMVNDSDTLTDFMGNLMYFPDSSSWYFFWAGDPPYFHALEVFYRQLYNGVWTSENQLSGPDTFYDGQPYSVVDTSRRVWVVWKHNYNDNPDSAHWDFWYRVRSAETGEWSVTDTVLVTPRNDWRGTSYLAGGRVFVSFNGDTINGQPVNYEVYATYWDGNEFTPETILSHRDWGYDESYDNVVGGYGDSFGRGHVTWREYWTGGLFYRQWADGHWGDIVLTIDTTVYYGYQSAIGVDPNTGEIYIVFDGYIKGTGGWLDVYLIHSSDGYHWSDPVRVNDNTDFQDEFPLILVRSENDIWVFWMKEITWVDTHVYGRHYYNGEWEPEVQIDNITEPSEDDAVAFGPDSLPWIFMTGGYGNLIDPFDVWYSHYVALQIGEGNFDIRSSGIIGVPDILSGEVRVNIYPFGRIEGKLGYYDISGRLRGVLWRGFGDRKRSINWDVSSLRSGVYLLYLSTPSFRERKKVVVIGK